MTRCRSDGATGEFGDSILQRCRAYGAFGIPTGLDHSARRCEARATPGGGPEDGINPERVASFALVTRTRMLQPCQGWIPFVGFTQGSLADSATRGLNDAIPLG